MSPYPNYLQAAKENEAVFRNILRYMDKNRGEISHGWLIPQDFKTDLPLDEFYALYSSGSFDGSFHVINFNRSEPDKACITMESRVEGKSSGTSLEYKVLPDNSVKYIRAGVTWR